MDENLNEEENLVINKQDSGETEQNNSNIKAYENSASLSSKKDPKPLILYIVFQILAVFVLGVVMGYMSAAALVESGADLSQMTPEAVTEFMQSQMTEDQILMAAMNVTFGMNFVLFIVFIIMYHKKLKEDAHNISPKILKLILASTGIIFIANVILTRVMDLFGIVSDNQNMIMNYLVVNSGLFSIANVILFAPVIEELTFRYSMGTLIKNKALFIIISSIAFGLIHGFGLALILYILLGVLFGLLYLKVQKNVMASIIVHVLNNSLSLILTFALAMFLK